MADRRKRKFVRRNTQKCRELACLAVVISDIFCAEFDGLIFHLPLLYPIYHYSRYALDIEPFSTAERSERVENFLFCATREYTEAGIEQAIVAMRRLGANSPEPRKRAVRE